MGDIPPELTVHYVSQEVNISDEASEWTPVQFVVHADVERRMLLAEKAELEAQDAAAENGDGGGGGDAASAARLNAVQTQLEQIDADTAEERAAIGIGPGLVRVSVGIESAEDILKDFQDALDAI